MAGVLLPLLGLGWFVGGGLLVLRAVGESLTFLGESPTAEELARSARSLAAAAWVAAGVPVLGLVLAVLTRRRAATVLFTVLLVLGLASAGLVAADRHRARLREPQPRAPVTGCQEHSGGDTDCPGG
ncbi:hypothetical protein SAMN04488543_2564 [Friedmanniella luteola]|uniref:Uncharacterized protein n=1 Tax=Friedmanniella luteola TaxID=546871 RepID=A0A1H1VSD8_9ACTN|nr:hypothetical protein [Friedmanniella luteola]SDS87807.1 hypothetical protein SAMN04488543_2564 [Friedmanniella luteola]